ncbi:PAS domain S-box protein [Aquifex aeolicus]|uniref:PAS domain-containing protein n=1 Tax=Aquifex aeolicus (strain VF5) TaxID=224324 RepID=O66671_AQUAE|nr:PAS domain S-box protein [Aquifex aeolicus]AAC06634.1 hypothetical protein aq_340 [Aquifex aeolicus VF5]
MFTFALCPHDTEEKKEFEYWENIAKSISEKLKEDVKIITFKDYAEEKLKLPSADYDIYYANPVSSYFLYKKGYKPLARLKGKRDSFVIIGYENVKDHQLTVTTTYIETHLLPVLVLEHFDFLKTNIFFVKTQKEIYESVKNKKADFGIMFEDAYNEIEDEEKVPVIVKIPSNLRHTLMVKPEIYKKLKEVIKEFEEFELIDDKEFLEGITENLPILAFLKTKELFDVSKAIYNEPFVGVLIYRDKIVYANETIQKLTGYTLEELQNLPFEELVAEEQREEIKEAVKRRLRGEIFSKGYENLKIKTKDGKYLYTLAFSTTMLYKNSYAGLVFFIDITKEVLYQKLYKALRNVNRAIATVLTEKELYKTVCETLVKELDIKFAWIGVPDEKTKTFKSIYKCGEEQDYLKHIKIYAGGSLPEAKGPTGRAYTEGKIVINPSTEENPLMKPWKEEMLKRGFLSSAAIPIMKNGKVHAVLNIYASIPHYFDEDIRTLLKELKQDLSFALEKIESIKESNILKIAIENSREWILITDKDGNIEYVNDFVSKLTGYKKEELIGKKPRIFKSGYHPKEFYEKLWKTILSGKRV